MARVYTAVFSAVAVTAQQDFFEVAPAAAKPVLILKFKLSQVSEVGDAQEEGLAILVKRGQTTTGSGGTTITANPVDPGDTAFAGTVKTNNTTKATAGTIVTLDATNWNIRVPNPEIYIPEERIVIPGGGRGTVELATTPIDSITISGVIVLEEIG